MTSIATSAPAPSGLDLGDLHRLAAGRHHDPHALLGLHESGGRQRLLAYLPGVDHVTLAGGTPLARIEGTDFFWTDAPPGGLPAHPALLWRAGERDGGRIDPYGFTPSVDAADLALFASGHHAEAWRLLGAHPANFDGVQGVRFAVWAPNAERVSLVGPFCDWDGRRLPMRVLGSSGVWELFVPGMPLGEIYKFEVRHRGTGTVQLKTDPYARAMERRPSTASIVASPDDHDWNDGQWLAERARRDWLHEPMSIYEVHLGSWERDETGGFLGYRELAERLIPYLRRLRFTHVELLPITEHPLDDSWGYQTTGYFAPTSRFGAPADLKYFIDQCHRAGIGVLLDWVPAHFPRDAHGLARFDGEPLYEHADPRRGEHLDWGTYIFDYGRAEVRSFLLSSACYWLEEFHFDGLRVDAVASMLYLDFGRRGDFLPNAQGGRENLEAVAFLRDLNRLTHARAPGTVVMAEESTDWPGVSRPVEAGGLGFSMKWNMGWMHDYLDYFKEDPLYRRHHHDKLTFVQMYACSENFILPLSHDEVVHLKRSLLGRMPGDRWQQLANLRLLYLAMWLLPGKKLLFMGGEFAQPWEWDFRGALPWFLTTHGEHAGIQRLVGDLNALYVALPAWHRHDFEPEGFSWIDCHDREHSTLALLRHGDGAHVAGVLNFTPVPRPAHRIGVPCGGTWRVLLNSDATAYGGSNTGNAFAAAEPLPCHGHPWSLQVDLPPLGGLVLAPEG